jgi:hypothetical protein
MKILLASILLGLTLNSFAAILEDNSIEFAIDVPTNAKVDKGASPDGSYVSISFGDYVLKETVVIQAMRITNKGKFAVPIPTVFSEFIGGMSEKMGSKPVNAIRTLPYKDKTLYVASHVNVSTGVGAPQGYTTVAYLAERGTWHKMILLQFISAANRPLSDVELLKRFASMKFDPALGQ